MEQLTQQQIRRLKQQAHPLKPIVTIGNKGLTESVLAEIERALYDHQLVKIKLPSIDRDQRQELAEEICKQQKANLINNIGRVAIIFRKSDKK